MSLSVPAAHIRRKRIILAVDVLLLIALLNLLPFEPKVVTGLSLLIFIAVLWLTEAIHVSITALLVPVLAVLLDVFPTGKALSSFADPIIFLFLGGFALASALSTQGLDKAIAAQVLNFARGRLAVAVLLLFMVSAGLSMWISNTATAAMMLPLALGMLRQLDNEHHKSTWIFTLLGIAYCASIGGIATLVGSPPNAIAAAQTGLTFMGWMQKALPLTLLLLPAAVLVLYMVLKPDLSARVTVEKNRVEWTQPRLLTLIIFAATVLCWIFSAPLNKLLGGLSSFDTLVAIAAIIALAVSGVVGWKDIERTTDWSVLLLFGGGLCLSAVLNATGTSLFLANNIGTLLDQASPLLVTLVIITFVVFLTEFASNTASAALLIPVFTGIAGSMGVDPVVLAVLIAVSASCAFMLPVATPPNAIVFGTGQVPQQQMMRTGWWLNLLCITLITGYATLFW